MTNSSDESAGRKDRHRIAFARQMPDRVHSVAGKILRRLDSVCGRFSGLGTKASNRSEAIAPASCDSDEGNQVSTRQDKFANIPYSPLSWRIGEESTADSRFISLIILAANHRAGSTLLQRICNSRKKTLIWGEHNALLRHFASIYADAARFSTASGGERERFFAQGENPNLWIANMCPELEYAQRAVVASARAFLRAFYSQYLENHDIIGFKEVQYGRSELELLRKCYPEANVLLLVRNPLNTWKSTPPSWYPSLDYWIEKWNGRVNCFRNFAAGDPNCHLLRYEDLIRRDGKTMEIVGETAKISRKQIKMVLAKKIGGKRGKLEKADKKAIGDRCRAEMEALRYI